MTRTCKDIRREFIEFFEQRGHTFVPSSPLLPGDDPTLLFTNAGMNQFKSIFLGAETRPYARAANSQKCIRAGGKHNDLEDVGHDIYHHTFFEMLGNWSFGDYFKAEAIQWAWELLTGVWRLPKDRLYATVFGGDAADGLSPDDEAERCWRELTDIDGSHIQRWDRKDNFWEMGETGPCGPCTEIHMDLTPDGSGGKLVNAGHGSVIEVWNLVFIQYDRDADGKLAPLPARHVDTGMGLERAGMILAGKRSNYATDLFVPIIERIETFTAHRYGAAAAGAGADRFGVTGEGDPGDVACRVVADHARALAFAIADGVIPGNEGRGYVLRRILRRAARYGRQHLGIDRPFLADLVPTIVDLMGDVFGELRQRQEYIVETIRSEEESFGRTLDRGIELFQRQEEKLRASGTNQLPGEVAFDLYATYGFPVDLTQLMAEERGLTVDLAGYEAAMQRHREQSSATGAFAAVEIPDLPATDDRWKYGTDPLEARVLGWVAGNACCTEGVLSAGDQAAVVLDRTNFYAETGGQVGDAGVLQWPDGQFEVQDTVWAGPCVLHVGRVRSGRLGAGQTVTARVGPQRLDTMRNHTATHLLNWALRRVCGEHVNQAGSVVAPDRLRFDFSHNQALAPEQLAEVERLVNDRILADVPVTAHVLPLAEAKQITGVRAVFGEKYPDPVRVLAVGTADPLAEADASCSAEFCGGTHLDRTGRIGLLKIVSEDSVAKGVRRITAVTGRGAVEYVRRLDEIVRSASAALRAPPAEVCDRIVALQKEVKELRRVRQSGPAGDAVEVTARLDTAAGKVVVACSPDGEAAALRQWCDQQRQRGAAAAFIGGPTADGKVTLVAMVTQELAGTGKLQAGEWVKAVAPIVGGRGGGKPTMAQAGGKQPEQLPEALAAAARLAGEVL